MANDSAQQRIERYRLQAQNSFTAFKERRLFWDTLVHRKEKPVLDPKVTNIGYYQTPDLRDEENTIIDVLTMNPTKFDANVLQEGTEAEQAVRDIVLWCARTAAMINNGRWVDIANAGGIARHGVKIMRLRHESITEPDDLPTGLPKSKDARDEAFRKRGNVFSVDDADTLSSSWVERARKTNVFVYQTEIPLADAYEEFRTKNGTDNSGNAIYRRPALNPAKELVWIGDDQLPEGVNWQSTLIKHVVVEYLDPDQTCPVCPDHHMLWSGGEYLCGTGQKAGDPETEVLTYTLPYRYQPSFRICGGRVNWLDKDPDERYQPMAYKLLVEASVINWCETMLLTLSNRDSSDDRVYATLAHISQEAVNRIPESVFENMAVPLPDPDRGEIPLVPSELIKWPTEMSATLTDVLTAARARFDAARVNRFLTGSAFKETAEGTGTMGLQQAQAAALPFNRPLAEMDLWWWELLQDMLHAIRLWDYDAAEGTEQKYYVTTTGQEQLRKGHADAGQAVWVSASKLEHDFDLVVKTENTTKQEEQATLQRAAFLYDRGDIDYPQYLEMIGYADVEHQQALLDKAKLRRRNEPMIARAQDYALAIIYSELSGIPQEILMGATQLPAVPGAPPTNENQPTGGPALRRPFQDVPGRQPTIQLPALNGVSGGTSPVEGPIGQ